jgi:hypothetical protein
MSTSPGITLNFKQSVIANIPGWAGHTLAHCQGWFGETALVNGVAVPKVHRVNRYLSNDPKVVKKQLDLLRAAGFDGITIDVQGALVNPFLHAAMIALWEGCMEHQMLFCVMIDPWMGKGQPNPTQAVIAQLQSTDFQRIFSSPCYLPEGFIIEFDLANSAGVNVATVQAAMSNNPLLSWHTGFSWPNIPSGQPFNPQNPAGAIAALKADNAQPTMKIAGVNIFFNDGGEPLPVGVMAPLFTGTRDYNTSAWGASTGANRVFDHQAGNYFFDQLAVTPATVPYVALVTFNDHDEQTGVEHVLAAFSGIRIGQ